MVNMMRCDAAAVCWRRTTAQCLRHPACSSGFARRATEARARHDDLNASVGLQSGCSSGGVRAQAEHNAQKRRRKADAADTRDMVVARMRALAGLERGGGWGARGAALRAQKRGASSKPHLFGAGMRGQYESPPAHAAESVVTQRARHERLQNEVSTKMVLRFTTKVQLTAH
mmetsp:Transcript_24362/g.71715  ORF Transcript_24362/g.71715 Transcript_24362/m.71715 type:complete len:172 (+) Transcript_24362:652-1167(+)